MNNFMSYVDDLMKNGITNSEEDSDYLYDDSPINESSFDEETIMMGGKINEHTGLGGFPPIYICSKEESDTELSPFEDDGDNNVTKVKREFSKTKSTVSINNIMEQRRNIKPFIKLN